MDYTALLLIAAAPALMVVQIYLLGRAMSRPEKMMRPIAGGLTSRQQETISRYKDWLKSVNLEFRIAFQFGTIQAAVFQQGEQPRFFSFLFHRTVTFNAESYLGDLTILDTANTRDVGLFPRPGAYVQSFPGLSAQAIWQRHLEGEAHLTNSFGFAWVPLRQPYEELVVAAMRLRMKHNRAQTFWPIRVLYRYAVTRRRLVNKSVAQQFP